MSPEGAGKGDTEERTEKSCKKRVLLKADR